MRQRIKISRRKIIDQLLYTIIQERFRDTDRQRDAV